MSSSGPSLDSGPLKSFQGEMSKTWYWRLTQAATRVVGREDVPGPGDHQPGVGHREALKVYNQASQLGARSPGSTPIGSPVVCCREGWSDEQLQARSSGDHPQRRRRRPWTGHRPVSHSSRSWRGKYLSSMTTTRRNEYAIRISEGSTNKEAVESMLRTEAKNRFGWLTEQIDQGLSPMDLFEHHRGDGGQDVGDRQPDHRPERPEVVRADLPDDGETETPGR